MVLAMTAPSDRRRSLRVAAARFPIAVAGRIRPGHQVLIVNASSLGVLIETSRRLLPGSRVELQLEVRGELHVRRAHVVRCYVGALRADMLMFRGALTFDQPCILLFGEAEAAATGALECM